MLSVSEVNGSGFERLGSGEHVSIRSGRGQDGGIERKTLIKFLEELVARLNIGLLQRRRLRQSREQDLGGSGDLLLLRGQALRQQEGVVPGFGDFFLALLEPGGKDDGKSGQKNHQQQEQ